MKKLKTNDSINIKGLNVLTEVLNAATHGLGFILGIVALVLLVIKADTLTEQLTYILYTSTFMALFLASTLYHSLIFTKARNIFRKIDHSSIFLLIAGTYTPYLILGINTTKAYVFAGFIWLLAITGIIFKAFLFDKVSKISTYIYLIMGWAVIFIIRDLIISVSIQSLILLVIGGLCYSLGVIFYVNKKLKFSHVYWHIAVLLGATSMFLSIYLYI